MNSATFPFILRYFWTWSMVSGKKKETLEDMKEYGSFGLDL